MKAAINKEQAQEITRWLEKQRVPKATIELLMSSQHASNTQKAFRMKKQITTPDGWGNVHFGSNWARAITKPDSNETAAKPTAPGTPKKKPISSSGHTEGKDIKKFGEDFLSRTFMGLAEKLKRIQIEDVDKPAMQKIALEVDKDHLAILKKMSAEKGTTVGNLIRVSIRDFIEKDH